METKANYVLVGIFTLVAIVAAFAFVYWTATIGDRGATAPLRIRILGSAAGLGRGSEVLFNGIPSAPSSASTSTTPIPRSRSPTPRSTG